MGKTTIEWADVPDYEGLYQVSTNGQVKRLGGTLRCKYDRILKQSRRPDGYMNVALSKDGKSISHLVHRLVCWAFIGKQGDYWVNHKNGDKSDNQLSNLEYVTPSENNQHAYDIGLRRKLYGENNPNSTISDEDAYLIDIAYRHARLELGGIGGIAQAFGVSRTTVSDIIHGKRNMANDT